MLQLFNFNIGRGDRIRTCGLLVPNQARYQTALRPDNVTIQLYGQVPSLSNELCQKWEKLLSEFQKFYSRAEWLGRKDPVNNTHRRHLDKKENVAN